MLTKILEIFIDKLLQIVASIEKGIKSDRKGDLIVVFIGKPYITFLTERNKKLWLKKD